MLFDVFFDCFLWVVPMNLRTVPLCCVACVLCHSPVGFCVRQRLCVLSCYGSFGIGFASEYWGFLRWSLIAFYGLFPWTCEREHAKCQCNGLTCIRCLLHVHNDRKQGWLWLFGWLWLRWVVVCHWISGTIIAQRKDAARVVVSYT